jgi:hypothetical protein
VNLKPNYKKSFHFLNLQGNLLIISVNNFTSDHIFQYVRPLMKMTAAAVAKTLIEIRLLQLRWDSIINITEP